MTNEEIRELRKGDIIYVPFVVDEVDRSLVYCHIPRTKDEFYFPPADIKSWERPRRKFCKGDVVETLTGVIARVSEDENEDGVGLDFLSDGSRRRASDLTLVMTAEEYAERMGTKGGADA